MRMAKGCGISSSASENVLKLMVLMDAHIYEYTAIETVRSKWTNCTVWEYVSIKLLESI